MSDEVPGPADYETRYEWLRPAQLIERRSACPLVFVPVGPLEYHGPHLPVGVDAINCARVAHACCRRLRKGVVLPTMMMGTERERTPQQIESLGFPAGTYVVGMDFPSRLWNSHYLPEEVFAIRLMAELRILIAQGYRYIYIANGHGATNQLATIDRLCKELNNTTGAKLAWRLTLSEKVLEESAGHADVVETSLLMHYEPDSVDLGTLPGRDVPIHTWEFSIVDGPGFSPQYRRDHVVTYDPRDATPAQGEELFEEGVSEMMLDVEKLIAS